MATANDLWALRYPDTHPLLMLNRPSGGYGESERLDAASAAGTLRVRCEALGTRPAVIFASEQMDDDLAWRMLRPGELVRVDSDLRVSSRVVIEHAPIHQMTLDELDASASLSQGSDHEPRLMEEPRPARSSESVLPPAT